MTLTRFIEAIEQQRLVHWLDNGFLRTLEPHLYGRAPGGREVLIAFQIGGGPDTESNQGWKLVEVKEGLTIDATKRFATRTPVPPHLLTMVRSIYASL